MRPILTIALAELRTLVCSPIAWLMLVFFTVQGGVVFVDVLEYHVRATKVGTVIRSLTDAVFYLNYPEGLFRVVQSYLPLYIPLLTMGLLSREYSSGSIKLLYSSPVTVTQIVGGKFLAMMGICLVLIGALAVFVFVGAVSINEIESGMLLVGLLGLYLLMCTYSAIGLFMSSLTSYQPVAAISTMVVLAGLTYMREVGQHIDFVRDLTYWLSISGRAESFIGGMVVSKDLIYFVLVTLMFLGFTRLKLGFERESKPVGSKVTHYSAVAVTVLALGYLSAAPAFSNYVDTTSNTRRTLSEGSQKVVRRMMDKPLTITAYVNVLDARMPYATPIQKNINREQMFEQYIRFKHDIRIEYVYYWDTSKNESLYSRHPDLTDEQLARRIAEAHNLNFDSLLTPAEIRKVIDLAPEENRVVWTLEYDRKKSHVRMFYDPSPYPGEAEITAGLKRLVDGPARIGYIRGHGERSIVRLGDGDHSRVMTYLTSRRSLINQGFEPIELLATSDETLENVDILVVADPLAVYSAAEQEAIANYIERGGNLVIMGEPERTAATAPLLDLLGLGLMDGELLRSGDTDKFTEDLIFASISTHAAEGSSGGDGFIRMDGLPSARISMLGATGVDYDDAKAREHRVFRVLESDAKFSLSYKATDSMESADNESEVGVEERTHAVGIALVRNTEDATQRILVLGDSDFMSNSGVIVPSVQTRNIEFVLEAFRWLSGGNYPIDVSRPTPVDTKLQIDGDDIFKLRVFLLGIVPGLMILFGGAVLFRRKRR